MFSGCRFFERLRYCISRSNGAAMACAQRIRHFFVILPNPQSYFRREFGKDREPSSCHYSKYINTRAALDEQTTTTLIKIFFRSYAFVTTAKCRHFQLRHPNPSKKDTFHLTRHLQLTRTAPKRWISYVPK